MTLWRLAQNGRRCDCESYLSPWATFRAFILPSPRLPAPPSLHFARYCVQVLVETLRRWMISILPSSFNVTAYAGYVTRRDVRD